MSSIVVSNTNDDGAGSLRQAIADANSNGTTLDNIIFDNTVFNTARTITLTTGELFITSNLTINGTGANLLIVSGNNNSRVFEISGGIAVTLSGMTITGGNGVGSFSTSGIGGGIRNASNLTISDSVISGNTVSGNGGGISSGFGTFSLIRSTVSNNTAAFGGGGLSLSGNVTLTNSTISGNTANSSIRAGGGVFFSSSNGSRTLQVTNCTIANNTTGTPNAGGGLVTYGLGAGASATALLRNTIIVDNSLSNLQRATASTGGTAVISSQGFNLASDNSSNFLFQPSDKVNVNPLLAPLANYGGTTPTQGL